MNHFLVRLGNARPELMTRALVEAHVSWLWKLHQAGQLLLCGTCPDGTALLVLCCASQEDAVQLADSDPFKDVAAYSARSVSPFRMATPQNNFLLGG